MEAIAQDNSLQGLFRRIGYSVGLEHLFSRAILLSEMYAKERDLSITSFTKLIDEEFKRKTTGKTIEEFANVYATLKLIKKAGLGIHPLQNLEALSILNRYFENDRNSFLRAARIITINAILEADGEIFLNALDADFNPQIFKEKIENTIQTKRQLIRKVIKSPIAVRKIYSIIDLKTQPGSGIDGTKSIARESKDRFEIRQESLDSFRRNTQITEELDESITVTDDYLRKVPITRKGWAEDLGLFNKGAKTIEGKKLLESLDVNLHLKNDFGCYIFWPFSSELEKFRIDPTTIGAMKITSWHLLCAIASGVSNISQLAFEESNDYSELIDLIERIDNLYKEGNAAYGAIRHQFPLNIIEPYVVAFCYALNKDIPPLPEIIEAEGKRDIRRFNIGFITGTEGGLLFRKKR